ncbi:MAG: Mur ligase family protein, partial [bacterium]|nr:Mur ligase family protein [bacterium]
MNITDRRADAAFLQFRQYGILGAGKSGLAAARLLARLGRRVVIFDDFADPGEARFAELAAAGIGLRFGSEAGLDGVQALVASPGIAAGHRLLRTAAKAGMPVRGELELAWLCAGGSRVVAVTGTNGKTTTTTLIEKICQQAGLRAVACGNIGHAFSDAVMESHDALAQTVFVVEVSSFQLETVEFFQPDVALILNVTPDHLDRHASMEEYARHKQRITDNQASEQTLVINQDDAFCLADQVDGFDASGQQFGHGVEGAVFIAPAGDQVHTPFERGQGLAHGVDVGGLGVVDILHAAQDGDQFHAMRGSAEFGQRAGGRRRVDTQRVGGAQSRQRVGHVVQADHREFVHRHEATRLLPRARQD